MTFTFKLSRRLATTYCGSMLFAALALIAGCNSSDLTTAADSEYALARSNTGTADHDTSGYRGRGRGRGRRDSEASLVKVVVSPDPVSVAIGETTRFAAVGVLSDGSEIRAKVTWNASGGTIDSTGLFTAGKDAGKYRVSAQSDSPELADTASVTVGANQVGVTGIVLSPATMTLPTGGTQRFTATTQLSDGTTGSAEVTYTATGGSIGDGGMYTAGSTAGTYRVIARQSGGTLADTAAVTITGSDPSPPPTGGTTYFSATAETATMNPWSLPWGVKSDNINPVPTVTQARVKNGGWAYKYEITDASRDAHYSQTLSGAPQASMGSPNGRYLSGYYSFWAYVDAGFTGTASGQSAWNMLLGWMTGVSGAPDPISNVGLEVWGGVPQIVFTLKNCTPGAAHYVCPNIPGYQMSNGWYRMSANSPAGVVPFPRQRWVHLVFYYKMAPTDGRVTIWQDGQKIMDLTAPTMNTYGGSYIEPLRNRAGDMMLQMGIYEGAKSDGVQRLYIDDFRVTDYRPVP